MKLSFKLSANQQGFASIAVGLIMIIVMALISVGFAQLARREQQNSLTKQLSSQAYYAAESGVNLVKYLMDSSSGSLSSLNKTRCQSAAPYTDQLNIVATQVINSCLLVNSAPTSLTYSSVDSNGQVIPIQADPSQLVVAGNTGALTIKWATKDSSPSHSSGSCPSYGTFPAASLWGVCPFGVLRYDMVDTTAAGSPLSEASLEANTVTVFAPPTSSSRSVITKPATAGTLSPGPVICDFVADTCSETINNVNYAHVYYLRMSSYYKPVSIQTISGQDGAGTAIQLVGAQVLVDSTGRAVDTLRRIQVRIPEHTQTVPSFAIESTNGICKQYTTLGPGTGINGSCP